MLFLLPRYDRWFGFLSTTKSQEMVDHQLNLEAWLQEASLFKSEPIDNAINLEELFGNEKADQEGGQDYLGLDDLGWLDEKVDLAIFDNPDSLLDRHYEMDSLIDDDAAFLLGLVDDDVHPSGLPSDSLKITDINLDQCLNSPSNSEQSSTEALDTHLASPGCTSLQVHSPIFYSAEYPVSPAYSDISDDGSDATIPSPATSQSTHGKIGFSSPEVLVTVCDSPVSTSSSDEAMSIEDVSTFVRKRKFIPDGETIPKVKVLLKELEVEPAEKKPAKKARTSKAKDRKERKKLQNKEAAARYRIKKRIEEKERSDEIADLEATQNQLKEKHDSLQSEIKYLKSLMCEILQKKGIMK